MPLFNYCDLYATPSGSVFRPVPFTEISQRATDTAAPYYQGVSRLYLLCEDYYGSPHFEQVLLLANPEWLSEFDIPDGTMLRIPLPLDAVLQELEGGQADYHNNPALNH